HFTPLTQSLPEILEEHVPVALEETACHQVERLRTSHEGRNLGNDAVVESVQPAAAFSRAAMSIFAISSIAFIARVAFSRSGSPSSLGRTDGMICHESPKRSMSHPH